jgi:hypothetical protein
MHTLSIASLSGAAAPRPLAAALRRGSATLHRFLNGGIVLAIAAQFYTIGLVMFGVTGLGAHRVLGSVLLVAALFSLFAAVVAGRTYARPRAAFGLFALLLLQPALAFGVRQAAPAFAALHAVNGLLALALAVSIELRSRRR